MKRPILLAVIGYIIGIIVGLYFSKSIVLIYVPITVVYYIYKYRSKSKKSKFKLISIKRYLRYIKIYLNSKVIVLIIFSSIVSNTIVIFQNKNYEKIYNNLYKKENINLLGTIISDKQLEKYYNKYKIKVKYNNQNINFYITTKKDIELEYGNKIIITGNYIKPEIQRNYKGFNYFEYLNYMNLDKNIFKPISREKFFEENHTNDKKEYYKYLDSITRTYPIDIQYLYNKTHDVVYKYILDKINRNILYCYKSDNCFDLYIRNSKGITLMFHKSIDTVNVNIIPNLPSNIEEYLVEKISNLEVRYSNMLGEVQVKDYSDIKDCVGVIISNNININDVKSIINKNNENIKIYKLVNNELIEIDN